MVFPAVFNVDNLNGADGFKLTSSASNFGASVAGIGDINGDGTPDLIVGTAVGQNEAFVIFGASHFPATFNASSLNGSNGFMLTASSNGFGSSVAGTGDINHDGLPDLIVGSGANKAFVIFGSHSFPARFDVSSLNGHNGFMLTSSDNYFGTSVARTGDVNDDGTPDLIVGTRTNKTFVIFGARSFPARLDTSNLNGSNGFMLISSTNDGLGSSVAGPGDINDDGISDLLVGALGANEAFVIFGANSFPAVLPTSSLNGSNGFTLTSSANEFGRSVAGAGDINHDGVPDLIIGSVDVNGEAFVIFGSHSFPAVLSMSDLNGSNGFVLTSSANNGFGGSVAGLGDISGDGIPDLIVSALGANEAFVVFGANHFPAVLSMSDLNGSNGFVLTSSARWFGQSVAGTGDVNDDGMPDLIVGTMMHANEAFVVFGQ